MSGSRWAPESTSTSELIGRNLGKFRAATLGFAALLLAAAGPFRPVVGGGRAPRAFPPDPDKIVRVLNNLP